MAPNRAIQTSEGRAKESTADRIASTRSLYRIAYCEKVVSEVEKMADQFQQDPKWAAIFDKEV